MDEGEPAVGVPHEQGSRADHLGQLGVGELRRVAHARQHRGGGGGELLHADVPLGGSPQGQCQAGGRVQPVGLGQRGRRSTLAGALLLVVEPGVDQFPVQVGRTDRPVATLSLLQPLVVQGRDEGQHPGIARQPQQVADAADQLHPLRGPPLGVRRAGRVNRRIPAVPVEQEARDLGVGEVLDPGDAPARDQVDPLGESLEHLVVGEEVLRATGQHDLRLVAYGSCQCAQMFGCAVVGHPQGELVEPVEQQDDSPRVQHVAERVEVEAGLPAVRQMGRDQRVQIVRLLQPA